MNFKHEGFPYYMQGFFPIIKHIEHVILNILIRNLALRSCNKPLISSFGSRYLPYAKK